MWSGVLGTGGEGSYKLSRGGRDRPVTSGQLQSALSQLFQTLDDGQLFGGRSMKECAKYLGKCDLQNDNPDDARRNAKHALNPYGKLAGCFSKFPERAAVLYIFPGKKSEITERDGLVAVATVCEDESSSAKRDGFMAGKKFKAYKQFLQTIDSTETSYVSLAYYLIIFDAPPPAPELFGGATTATGGAGISFIADAALLFSCPCCNAMGSATSFYHHSECGFVAAFAFRRKELKYTGPRRR